MRGLAVVMLLACSSKTEAPKSEQEPTVRKMITARPVCPKGVNDTNAWTHEVFPGCAAPQFHGLDASCDGACPKPCRIVSEQFGKTRTRTIEYDDRGRYVATRDGNLSRSCAYDDAGRMKSCGDAKILRDASGRIVRVDGADGLPLARFTYDERGRPIETFEEGIGTTAQIYDEKTGRLVREKVPGEDLVYHYDAHGRVTHFDARSFKPDRWTYDADGRLVETAYADTRETYTYDAKGRPASYLRESLGKVQERTTIEYCERATAP